MSSTQHIFDFYESEEYRPLRDLRHRSAKTSIVITEGVAGTAIVLRF